MFQAILNSLRTDRSVIFACLLVLAAHPLTFLLDSFPALDAVLSLWRMP